MHTHLTRKCCKWTKFRQTEKQQQKTHVYCVVSHRSHTFFGCYDVQLHIGWISLMICAGYHFKMQAKPTTKSHVCQPKWFWVERYTTLDGKDWLCPCKETNIGKRHTTNQPLFTVESHPSITLISNSKNTFLCKTPITLSKLIGDLQRSGIKKLTTWITDCRLLLSQIQQSLHSYWDVHGT